MTSAARCNVLTYFMFTSAIHLMSSPNVSVTGEWLTKLRGQIGADRVFNWGITLSGNMGSASRGNAVTYLMLVSATHLMSSPICQRYR